MYITEEEFVEEVLLWKENDVCTLKLATILIELTNKIAASPRLNYKITDDNKQNALLKILLYGKKFDPNKGKCFSYFSQIVLNSYIFDINAENKINFPITKTIDELENNNKKES